MEKNNKKTIKNFKKTLKKIINELVDKRGNVPKFSNDENQLWYYSISCVGYNIELHYDGEIKLKYYNGSKYTIHNKDINDFNFYDYLRKKIDKKFSNEYNLMNDFCKKYKKA